MHPGVLGYPLPACAALLSHGHGNDIREVKVIRDKAEALRRYAEASGAALEEINAHAEYKIRLDRQCGMLLASMEMNQGGAAAARILPVARCDR